MFSLKKAIKLPVFVLIYAILLFSLTACTADLQQSQSSGNLNTIVGENVDLDSNQKNSTLKVHYIDVGQADSILVQSGDSAMLIDAGNNQDGNLVVDYIKSQGIKKLDYVIGTHPHEDHIGGLDNVIKTFDIGKIIMPKETSTTKTFKDVINAIKSKKLKITSPIPSEKYSLGKADFTILAPNSSSYKDVNDNSVVVMVVNGSNKFLLTGDAEIESEKEMIARKFDLKADVLKIGHHGSNSSTSMEFLAAVKPKYAVISVGTDNDYGHPKKTTLDKLKDKKISTYRTDKSGTIIATSDGNEVKFNVKAGD